MEEEEELQRLQEEAERRDYNREEPEDSELQSSRYEDELDARFGIRKVTEGPARLGWLYNVRPTVIEDSETHSGKAALQLYFIGEDGQTFKAPLPFHPYIYLELKHAPVISSKSTVTPSSVHTEVEQWLRRKYERLISSIEFIAKEDLQLKNHLSGLKKIYMKISFPTVQALLQVRKDLLPLVKKNQQRHNLSEIYEHDKHNKFKSQELLDSIIDIREYDIRYYMRVCIDKDVRCGNWYSVKPKDGGVLFEPRSDLVQRADPKILAFDIETTKQPLKFPDASIDSIMMISYMLDGDGYLIVNRQIVSEDIEDFECTPKPEYPGPFTVFNVPNELELLKKFFSHIRQVRPHVFVSFNGDAFDWPFIDARAKHHHLDMYAEIGVKCSNEEYVYRYGSHLDVYHWVLRDSYLPHGSHGLKAVTKAKLGYNPLELNPEDMVRFASEQPQMLASYSVSDAVATYYLYLKYVHPFIYSLCTIIPMHPDDVLRKGSGTLCEALLETQAFKANVIFPNRQTNDVSKMYEGHLLESETYVGGHVEALESGVFRSDIPTKFKLDTEAIDMLINDLDNTLAFAVETEGGLKLENVTNYQDIRNNIAAKLQKLKDVPRRIENPVIYHLDVAAMYPNIILTNRLQPSAIVNEEICASCDFNKPENNCQRMLKWTWRGEYIPANRSEYERIRIQSEAERFPDPKGKEASVGFYQLSQSEQQNILKKRLKEYSKKVYRSMHKSLTETRNSTVCMRENPFYVDTVRAFRDRRYLYKGKLKEAQKNYEKTVEENQSQAHIQEAQKLIVLYDSLQLAHKCILNSFYGYVMRRGSRWYSMEMAGTVTYTGAQIITQARELIERIGRPLELDTDGIWCVLPASFPQNYKFECSDKRSYTFSYPCTMLNRNVSIHFTNDQYQTLVDAENHVYSTRSECSVFFEVDGPYKAMILPAAKEEGKKLKKRYAVFNSNNTLAELKGFEVKRRGELKLIKTFQSQIFEKFLEGKSLSECYQAVAQVANSWLDILDSKGETTSDAELLDLLTESSTMSKKLDEYGKQKSSAITAAKRLAEFLGKQIQSKGLNCAYVVSKKPVGAPVTERVIPTAVFSLDSYQRSLLLSKWCHCSPNDVEIRDILDWQYYKERLASVIQKIITIPAAMQKIDNPVPRVSNPTWLQKQLRDKHGLNKQSLIDSMFQKSSAASQSQSAASLDMESIGERLLGVSAPALKVPTVTVHKKLKRTRQEMEADDTSTDTNDSNDKNDKSKESAAEEGDEYDKWLQGQKQKWRAQLAARKKRIQMFGRVKHNPMHNIFGESQMNLTHSQWQIVQIAERDTPGMFTIWALIGANLHSIALRVPRTFYINSLIADPQEHSKQVSCYLPRSKPRHFLYQYTIDELDYRLNSKALSHLFTRPEVEGVYETKVPLLFRAVVSLGCTAALTPAARRAGWKDSFSLQDLEFRDAKQLASNASSYLSGNPLKQIYLYHSSNDALGAVFGVFFAFLAKGTVFIVNSFTDSQIPAVKKVLKDKLSNYETAVIRVKSMKSAYKELEKLLLEYKAQGRGPSMLLSQSTRPFYELRRSVAALNDFPVVQVPANEQDNRYVPLGWEVQATHILLQRFSAVDDWYRMQLEHAAYAQIPIGNIESDYAVYIADVMLARLLSRGNQLLWVSDTSKPDLGGSEEDDNSFAEELESPEVSEPSWYRTFCVELDVIGLAVNTILEASKINEIEGGASLLTLDLHSAATLDEEMNKTAAKFRSFDESFANVRTFRVIKKLVTDWSCTLGESNSENDPADNLLAHFYRWMSSAHSKLYDPSLHRFLHNLMKKVFWQLIAEFRKLGATVVYGNFNKIILCTSKKSLEDTKAYCDFILRNIKKKELFAWIDMEPHRYWQNLLFMDNANFGGIKCDADSGTEMIIAHWNIADFLPSATKQIFDLIISDFILHLRNSPKVKAEVDKENSDPNPQRDAAPALINTYLTQRLFQIIENIQHSLDGEQHALAFIKTVCAVLSLDKSIETEVFRLKKGLLKLITVREFSQDAEFVNPCPSYVLTDVICTHCNSPRDMDLLRDLDLLQEKWSCKLCQHEYHKPSIEARLVEIVEKRSLCYQLQDLICSKCKQVKVENMRDICAHCSGRYVTKHSEESFKDSIRIFKKIAELHKFEWLEEISNAALQ